MKYSDIIGLQDYFQNVFNLQNEATGYWKQFIPTTQFTGLLDKTLDAVSSNIPSYRKSIWVKGTFGTGKSHASAVVKHLMCNDLSEISDYLEDRILLAELKTRLLHFRKSKRLFPVVLKGTESGRIYDMRSFLLTLEHIIKDSLRNSGYSITVQSDFEKAITYLETTPININEIIANEPELRSYAKSKEDIIKKLRTSDVDVYLALEEALAETQQQKVKEKYAVIKEDCDSFDIMPLLEAEKRSKQIILNTKIEMFIASFSGGKDSQVVLDLVSRIIPSNDFLKKYKNT